MSAQKVRLQEALNMIRNAGSNLRVAGLSALVSDLNRIAAKVVDEMEHMKSVENHPDLFKS